MPSPNFSSFIFFLLFHTSLSFALNIFISTNTSNETEYSNITLASFYSTLGPRLATPLFIPKLSFLSSTNISPNCHFRDIDVNGTLVVFVGSSLPSFHKCTRDKSGRNVAFARVAQEQGALGVITVAEEKV